MKNNPNYRDKEWQGLSKNLNLDDIAEKHDVYYDDIKQEYDKGLKMETEEHGAEYAKNIALDHLVECPEYYTKLEEMEEKNEEEDEETVKEEAQ